MKKTILTILVFLVLILPACAGQSPATGNLGSAPTAAKAAARVKQNSTTPTATQGASTTAELNTSYENAASIELQLLLGTLKLDGTDLAVTQEQASALLPLWNNLKAISQSMMRAQGGSARGQGNATPQLPSADPGTGQIGAVAKQIMAAMTPKQIKAIAEMKITQQTAMTIMQEQGIMMGGPKGDGSGNQPPNGASPAGGQQLPQGTPPAGGPNSQGGNGGAGAPPSGALPGGGQLPPQGTPPAGGPGNQGGSGDVGAPPAGGGMVPPELIDAVIQLLEQV